MIKVSHEVPKQLFSESNEFNDYDYCLVHMCEKDPEYLQFYVDQAKKGRTVYLDNSAFELGQAVTEDFLLDWAAKINPTHIIPPDVLHDGPATLKNLDRFLNTLKERNLDYKVIAVAQGKTEREFVECFKEMMKRPEVNVIAIPYDIKFYDQFLDTRTQNRFVLARQMIIETLLAEHWQAGIWKPVHLLGCSNPLEFKRYGLDRKKYDFINSIDTSSPIIHGIFGQRISYEKGLPCEKIKDLLADNLDRKINEAQLELIRDNITTFKQLLGRQ